MTNRTTIEPKDVIHEKTMQVFMSSRKRAYATLASALLGLASVVFPSSAKAITIGTGIVCTYTGLCL